MKNRPVIGQHKVGEELLVESDDAGFNGLEFGLHYQGKCTPALPHSLVVFLGSSFRGADQALSRGVCEPALILIRQGEYEPHLAPVRNEADHGSVLDPSVHEPRRPVPGEGSFNLDPRRGTSNAGVLRISLGRHRFLPLPCSNPRTPSQQASPFRVYVSRMPDGDTAPRPPYALALAKAVETFPRPDSLPGGCWFEPKWGGFRAVITTVDPGRASMWSRQNRDLARFFPDLIRAANQIPPGCVVDGEAVIWSFDRLNFDALQQRMITCRAELPALVLSQPASFVAFDVLAVAGHDTRAVPFSDRRALLEELAREWTAPLNLSPVTRSLELAKTWFEELPAAGLEGLVCKGGSQRYEGGKRQWLVNCT